MAEFMQKDLRDEKGLLVDGEKLSDVMNKAGFVDVRKRQIKIEIGPWGPGSFPFQRRSNRKDPGKHEIASTCANVWTQAMRAFGAQLLPKRYPDEADAEAFLEAISRELHNPDYHLFCYLYPPFLVQSDRDRYLVMGRRPSVSDTIH